MKLTVSPFGIEYASASDQWSNGPVGISGDCPGCAGLRTEVERLREKVEEAEASEIILADQLGYARIEVERLRAVLPRQDGRRQAVSDVPLKTDELSAAAAQLCASSVPCDDRGRCVACEIAALRAELAVSRKANESNGLAYEHVVELYEVEKARADRLEAALREIAAHHRDQASAWTDEDTDGLAAEYHAERAAVALREVTP